ncbi:unnamed protein product [Orchesella dallaii]|uniref:G protein-coupled receptor n=1 Tax=Orchesella dallaii TaxID=48710 RepID=A0ABP1RDH0_9HEXA
MLSERIYAFIEFFVPALAFIGVVPYSWDKNKRLLITNKWARYRIRLNGFIILTWVMFPAIQAARFHFTQNYDYFNITYVCATAGIIPLETFGLLIFFEDGGLSMFNSCMLFLRHMNKVYIPHFNPNKSKYSIFVEIGIFITFLVFLLLIFMYCISVFVFPNAPNLFGSLLPKNTPFIIRLVVNLQPCYCMFIIYMHLYAIFLLGFIYDIVIIPFIITEFRLGRKKKYVAIEQLRRPPMLVYAYRTVQLLQQNINHIVGFILIPTQAVLGKIIVFSTFTVVKHGDSMKTATKVVLVGWSVMMALAWCTILLVGGAYMPLYDPNRELYTIIIEIILVFAGILVGLVTFVTSLFFFLFPHASCLIGSAIPENTFFLIRLPMLYIFPHYLSYVFMGTAGCIIEVAYIYALVVVPFILKELRLGRRYYVSVPALRQPANLMMAYRTAQILHERVLNIFQYLIVPLQTVITNLIIFCCVMIIKYGRNLKPSSIGMLVSWGLFGLGFWYLVLLLGGYLYMNGKKVLLSWKYHLWNRRAEAKMMSKFRRSCRPIMINFGRTYVIKRLSVLKFLRGVSRGILRTLLTLTKDK